MVADGWDLRSNIKGKPGSQGTLFGHDKSVLNPAQRWPRGYTPERQAEVKDALKNVPMKGRYDPDHEHFRARVEDTVARSTIPVDHLRGLAKVDAHVKPGTVGTYWPAQRRLATDMLNRDQWKDDSVGQTLVHELGHHRDATAAFGNSTSQVDQGILRDRVTQTAERANQASKFPTPEGPNSTMRIQAAIRVDSGLAEGYADNYMEEHYRTRGRNPQPVTEGRYEKHFSQAERDDKYPGYHDLRPPKPPAHMGPQFQQQGELLNRNGIATLAARPTS